MSLQFGSLLAGSLITETIFSWPGIGRLTVQAIQTRDYPLVQGCVLVIAVSYILVNFITDICLQTRRSTSHLWRVKVGFMPARRFCCCLPPRRFSRPRSRPIIRYGQNLDKDLIARSSEHWLGTDKLGRDILSRIIYGGRISLLVGITTVALSLAIGVVDRLPFRLLRRLDRSNAHAPGRYFDGVSRHLAGHRVHRRPGSWSRSRHSRRFA